MYARNDSFHVMRMSISDSDTSVNHDVDGFGIIIPRPATVTGVAGNRDDVLSSFVRMKIRAWRDGGRELKELAAIAGVAKSSPSQVLLGTGVARKTAPGYARAFGYPSEDALKAAAWEWWKAEGQAGEDAVFVPRSEAQKAAIELVLGLQQGTATQLATILSAYSHPRFHDRDRDWWVQTLLAELKADKTAIETERADRREVQKRQGKHRAIRREAEKKAAAAEALRVTKSARRSAV